jgi:hypothetical protein
MIRRPRPRVVLVATKSRHGCCSCAASFRGFTVAGCGLHGWLASETCVREREGWLRWNFLGWLEDANVLWMRGGTLRFGRRSEGR